MIVRKTGRLVAVGLVCALGGISCGLIEDDENESVSIDSTEIQRPAGGAVTVTQPTTQPGLTGVSITRVDEGIRGGVTEGIRGGVTEGIRGSTAEATQSIVTGGGGGSGSAAASSIAASTISASKAVVSGSAAVPSAVTLAGIKPLHKRFFAFFLPSTAEAVTFVGTKPLAGATVTMCIFNAAGTCVQLPSVPAAVANSEGNFSFANVPNGSNYTIMATLTTGSGKVVKVYDFINVSMEVATNGNEITTQANVEGVLKVATLLDVLTTLNADNSSIDSMDDLNGQVAAEIDAAIDTALSGGPEQLGNISSSLLNPDTFVNLVLGDTTTINSVRPSVDKTYAAARTELLTKGSLGGSIMSAATGKLLGGVAITLFGATAKTVTSGTGDPSDPFGLGSYHIDDLAEGSYAVTVSALGFVPINGAASVSAGQFKDLDFVLTAQSPNLPPAPVAAASPTMGTIPLTVSFSAAGSSDPNGDPMSFKWDFGSLLTGCSGSGDLCCTESNVCAKGGDGVCDCGGAFALTWDAADCAATPLGSCYAACSGNAMCVEYCYLTYGGSSSGVSAQCSFPEGTATGTTTSHTYTEAGTYTVTLTVADSGNLSGTTKIQVTAIPGASGAVAKNTIVFGSRKDTGAAHELYLATLNSSNSGLENIVRITFDQVDKEDPAFLRDGTGVLYAAMGPANYDIFLLKFDGSIPSNLTKNLNPSGNDRFPSASPDGSQFAFYSDRDGDEDIYVMNFTGNPTPTNLTDSNPCKDIEPDFSPAGGKIVYTLVEDSDSTTAGCQQTVGVNGQPHAVYTMDTNGTGKTKVSVASTSSTGKTEADFKPDGAKIAYTSTSTFAHVIDMTVTPSTDSHIPSASGNCSHPSWLSTGNQLVYEGLGYGSTYSNFIIFATLGGNAKAITNYDARDPEALQ